METKRRQEREIAPWDRLKQLSQEEDEAMDHVEDSEKTKELVSAPLPDDGEAPSVDEERSVNRPSRVRGLVGKTLWTVAWGVLAIAGVFALTLGGTLLFNLRWGDLVATTLGLSIGIAAAVALGGLLVSSIFNTLALRQIARGGGAGGLNSQMETLRPILVLPPPTIGEERRLTHKHGELEAGPHLQGGHKWNGRVYNIGAGPALNGEARLYRRSDPENAIILTVEPLGAGQFVDLASVEMPSDRVDDLEFSITYQDTYSRRFITRYRLYSRGEGEASFWIGPADIEHLGIGAFRA